MAKKIKESKPLDNPFPEPYVSEWWGKWKEYKKQQFYFTYKPIGEQAAIDNLYEISNKDANTAVLIIKQSIANGWRGLFELKTSVNATVKAITQKPNPTGNIAPGGFGNL